MIALIQRVAQARVTVDGRTTGEIGAGLLALVCAERGDTEAQAERLLAKLLAYRVFSDEAGKMNLPVQDIDGRGTHGGLLVVSQFTLAADTNSGTRPSFTPAAAPPMASACTTISWRVRAPRLASADRRVRRDDAGQPGQRRSGHLLAARAAGRAVGLLPASPAQASR